MEKTIKITIDTATRWYNSEDAELKKLALQAFPELGHEEIEMGTLVWFKEIENQPWGVGYYSHFDPSTKSHKCFRGKGDRLVSAIEWNICTAKNPFLEDEKSYQLFKKALKVIKSLRGTIQAHPDYFKGGEFRDQSVAAWDLIQEIKKFMES